MVVYSFRFHQSYQKAIGVAFQDNDIYFQRDLLLAPLLNFGPLFTIFGRYVFHSF